MCPCRRNRKRGPCSENLEDTVHDLEDTVMVKTFKIKASQKSFFSWSESATPGLGEKAIFEWDV